MENKVKNIPKGVLIGESIFDIAYLLFAFTASAVFFSHGTDPVFFWYGWLTLILALAMLFTLFPESSIIYAETTIGCSGGCSWACSSRR